MTRNMKRVGLERKGIVGKVRLDKLGMEGLGGSLDIPLLVGTFAVAVKIAAGVVVVVVEYRVRRFDPDPNRVWVGFLLQEEKASLCLPSPIVSLSD